MPDPAFRPTWLRWYNAADGAKIASADVGSYEAIPYGAQKTGEKYADGKPPHPETGQWQWGLACSKTSRTIVIDVDRPSAWKQGAVFVELGEIADAATSRREDGERFHIAVEVPAELVSQWPVQGPAVWGDVKSNGFSYTGGVHHTGMRYTETGRGWVTATAGLMSALTEDRIFPQGRGSGAAGVMAGPWEDDSYRVESHDECVATVMSMVGAGLDDEEIVARLAVIMPNREGDWPGREAYIDEKIRSARRKVEAGDRREREFWGGFHPGGYEGLVADLNARREAMANITPAAQAQALQERNARVVAAGQSLRHVSVADIVNPYRIPVEHRLTSDQGIGRDILQACAPVLQYAEDEDTWYQFEGLRWITRAKDFGPTIVSAWAENLKPVSVLDAEMAVAGTAESEEQIAADDKRRERHLKNHMRLTSNAGQNAIGAQLRVIARGNPAFRFRVADLDAEPHVLWAGGQPWNLLSPGLAPATEIPLTQPHLKSALCFPVPGPTPVFDQVLTAVWPDEGVRAWALREIAGLMLWGATSKVHPVLDGPSGGGKSTFALILTTVLDSYAVQVSPDKILSADMSSGADEEIAAMIGARCVWMDEPPPGGKQAVSRFNDLASGTGSLSAARKYQNRVTAPKRFNFLICQNPRNALRMDAQGVGERMLYIPCNGAAAATEAAWAAWIAHGEPEYPAILARLIYECAMFRTGQRLETPVAAQMGRAVAQERSDEFGAWLADTFQILDAGTLTTDPRLSNSPTIGRLRTDYNDGYARANGLPRIGAAEIEDQLARLGVKVATAGTGNSRKKNVVFVAAKPFGVGVGY